MVPRGRALLRGHADHPGGDEDGPAAGRADAADAERAGAGAGVGGAGAGGGARDWGAVRRVQREARRGRAGGVYARAEGEHARPLGQDCQDAAVCRDVTGGPWVWRLVSGFGSLGLLAEGAGEGGRTGAEGARTVYIVILLALHIGLIYRIALP